MQILRYSTAGFAMTKRFEGLRLDAYQDVVGVLTIGYGHTGPDVHKNLVITEQQAEMLLRADLRKAELFVNAHVTGKLTQGMFDALVDFVFNLGEGALLGSTLLRKLNAGDKEGAAAEFLKWDHAGGRVVEGLLQRRKAEQALYVAASAPPGIELAIAFAAEELLRAGALQNAVQRAITHARTFLEAA